MSVVPTSSQQKPGIVRIAVIGDPHFVSDKHPLSKTSHLKLDSSGALLASDNKHHPWGALLDLVNDDEALTGIDLLVCVGDVSTGGDEFALNKGWQYLNDFAKKISAGLLVSATGNHDVRSRSQAEKVKMDVIGSLGASRGPFEHLKLLSPPYPVVADLVDGEGLRTQYFGDGVVLIHRVGFRVIVINSCGEHTGDNIDYEKGSFPVSSKNALEKALKNSLDPGLNILVCHHPPTPHGQDSNDYDFITGGPTLLNCLENHGAWLVVHGHKHQGQIRYAPGGGGAPVVFAAASLGTVLEESGQGQRNQFYVIELEGAQGRLLGHVRSWDWFRGQGYQPSTPKNGGIFDSCGFGCRDPSEAIANKIVAQLGESLPVSWSVVQNALPDLKHVLPAEFERIEKALKKNHSIAVDTDSHKTWTQLARAA